VVCGSASAELFAQVSAVPVHTTILWRSRQQAQNAPRGDLRLVFCHRCGHIANTLFDQKKTEYSEAYENSLHFSPLFQGYAEGLSDRLIGSYGIREKKIVEIGVGKGDFLAMMCRKGNNRGTGFDPSYVDAPEHADLFRSGKMQVVREMYPGSRAAEPADLVVCRQVLEHIPNPRPFLETIRTGGGLKPTSVLFFEVPNSLCPLRDLDVWTLIYEHCSFYTPDSLGYLFRSSGFDVTFLGELYEGIFLGIDVRPADTAAAVPELPQPARTLEQYVKDFSRSLQQKTEYWRNRLARLAGEGKRVAVWGAGARGVTFLNMVDPGMTIGCVVDINPRKEGTFAAGTGQRIVGPSFLPTYRPDVVILMNAIYRHEIEGRLGELGVRASLERA
jgi:2-polyprenyl-3-methyl-5-hydroxy-6-metoxy-1,4-benzoquinol methylase